MRDRVTSPTGERPTRRPSAAFLRVVVLTLLAFALRVIPLNAQSLWRDEVDAMCYAFGFPRALAEVVESDLEGAEPPCACPPTVLPSGEQGESSVQTQMFQIASAMIRHNGPLYYFLLRGWISLTGTSVLALRFFSSWFGVLCIPLSYALVRRVFGQTEGLVAALLTSLSPYLIWYSQEVKMYTLVPAMVLMAIYALRRAVDGGGTHWWLAQVLLTGTVPYVHIWSTLLIPVQVSLFLVWWPRSRNYWLAGLTSLALCILPYLPMASWIAGNVFVRQETGFPHYTLGEMITTLLNVWGTGRAGLGGWWGEIGYAGAAVLGLVSALPLWKRREDWRSVVGLLTWILIPMLGIWFVSIWRPLFTDRYLAWTTPAYLILVSVGLVFLWRHSRWLLLPVLAAVLVASELNLWSQVSWPLKSDFRAAASFVEEDFQEGDLLLFQIPHGRYTFDYYFGPTDYDWVDGLYTNYRSEDGEYDMTRRSAAAHLEVATWRHSRVWLVASEMEMWDQRHLVQEWLEAHAVQTAEGRFLWADVYLYELATDTGG